MHSPLFIGLRYARAGKASRFIAFINLFSVVGIALGLAALIVTMSVMNGFEGQLKKRILGILPHISAYTTDANIQQQLLQLDQVKAITEQIQSEAVLQSSRDLKGVLLQGVTPDAMTGQSIIAQHMQMGALANLTPGSYGVVIGRALSIQLNVRLGEQVRLLSAQSSVFTPFGRTPSQRLFTVVGIYDVGSEMDDKVVLANRQDVARLLRKHANHVSFTRLYLHDPFAYLPVVTYLQQQGIDSDNWRSRQGPLFDAVKMEKNMMSLMLVLIIAVAVFNSVSALVMLVAEKQGDIAILQTQGMSNDKVMTIFMVNGLYNGVKGTLIGLLLGVGLVSQLNPILALLGVPLDFGGDGLGLPIDLRLGQVAWLIGLSLALCFLATLYPAWRASRVAPANALKYQ